ncbi:MAG: ABC transporter permease [Promethearchaeota archaeon]
MEKSSNNFDKNRKKKRLASLILFYLLPGWRLPEFTNREYKIEKMKSKRRFFRHLINPLTILGFLIFSIFIFMGIFSPWLTEYALQEIIPPQSYIGEYLPPTFNHPLGTTNNGYDVLARIIWGSRTSLFMGMIPVIIAIGGGLIIGTISAYFGEKVDYVIMRVVDLIYSLPTLIIVLILIRMIGIDMTTLLIIYGSFAIAGNVRFMRSLVLQVKGLIFVKAAKTGGASKFKIMFRHIVPNALPPMIINFFGGIAATILGIAALSFLGLGDNKIPNWGIDIYNTDMYKGNILSFIFPGLCTALFAIGAMLIGDGLRDAIDPRLKI